MGVPAGGGASPATPEPASYPSTAGPAPADHVPEAHGLAEHAPADQTPAEGAGAEDAPAAAYPATLAAPASVDRRVPATRASRAWLRIVPALILLAVLLVFVFQNLHSVKVTFMTASGRFPLAVALLAAAALGALTVLVIGSVRIVQLRKLIRRRHQAEVSRHAAGDT